MKNLIIAALICLSLSAVGAYAQKSSTAPKFSSVYTDLKRDCKTIKGEGGTDDAGNCRGIGGYRIHVWFSATTQHFGAETPKTKDLIPLATLGLDFDQTKVKVEWRLANGKPFAVIMRVDKYGEPDADTPYIGKKIGRQLIVRGLKGFENIDFAVDAGTPNANVEARKLADRAFFNK